MVSFSSGRCRRSSELGLTPGKPAHRHVASGGRESKRRKHKLEWRESTCIGTMDSSTGARKANLYHFPDDLTPRCSPRQTKLRSNCVAGDARSGLELQPFGISMKSPGKRAGQSSRTALRGRAFHHYLLCAARGARSELPALPQDWNLRDHPKRMVCEIVWASEAQSERERGAGRGQRSQRDHSSR